MNKFPVVKYVTHTSKPIGKLGSVKFRTFTVGEHRQFLEAKALGDESAIFDTLLNILEACTFGNIPVRKTEMYLLDMLYLEIYIKTKGAASPGVYRCTNMVTDPMTEDGIAGEEHECGNRVTVNIPLMTECLQFPEGFDESQTVSIGENSGMKLRQPTAEEFQAASKGVSGYDLTDQFVYSSVECMWDGDRLMHPGIDYDLPGLVEYIGTLPDYVMDHIQAFYELTPSIKLDMKIKCPKCGNEDEIHLDGLDDFFL